MIYIFQCDNCGRWRCAQPRNLESYMFTCYHCGTRKKIIHKNSPGITINYIKEKNPNIARRICMKKNEIQGKMKDVRTTRM